MLPGLVQSRFEEADRLLPAAVGQPDLGLGDLEVRGGVPLPSVERPDQDHVPEWDAEELHQVEHQGIGGTPGSVEEAERGLEAGGQDRPHDGGVEQTVAEAEEGVESVDRRATAPESCSCRDLGDGRGEELGQPSEVSDGGRTLQAAERVAVGDAPDLRRVPIGSGPGRGASTSRERGVAARASEEITMLTLDLGMGQGFGQAEAGRFVGQGSVLAEATLDLAGGGGEAGRYGDPRS